MARPPAGPFYRCLNAGVITWVRFPGGDVPHFGEHPGRIESRWLGFGGVK